MNAYHNWGRWIVDCSSPNCVGSLKVIPGTTMVVCDCRDRAICTHGSLCAAPTSVEWPDSVEEIVQLLSLRPLPNRNWYPNETVADLERENMTHGVGV